MSKKNLINLEEELFKACKIGDLEKVKELVKLEVDVHIQDEWALRCAALNGHFEIVKYLVKECNSDVHSWNENALRCAAFYGHLEIVKYLIEECKADVHALDFYDGNNYKIENYLTFYRHTCYSSKLTFIQKFKLKLKRIFTMKWKF